MYFSDFCIFLLCTCWWERKGRGGPGIGGGGGGGGGGFKFKILGEIKI
jgi:hypothetical protein